MRDKPEETSAIAILENSNGSDESTSVVPVTKQIPAPAAAVAIDDKKLSPPGNEEPLCDDILSCISALDDVIAEFDDSISASSIVLGEEEPPPEVNPPEIPRVTCSVNVTSTEPTVTILQTHSQTVTEIQIGNFVPAVTSSQPLKMSTSPPKVHEPLQLQQSHFSPAKVTTTTTASTPTKIPGPTFRQEKGPLTYPLEVPQETYENLTTTGNSMSYGLIFPKGHSNGNGARASSPAAAAAATAAPPAPFPRTRRSAAAGKATDCGGSYPKMKEPIYEVIAESCQSVKVRSSPKSGAYKELPSFPAQAPAESVDDKRAQLLLAEEWNFPSEQKLPRSLRKTRRKCLDEEEAETGGKATAAAIAVLEKIVDNPRTTKAISTHTHAVQLRVEMGEPRPESSAIATATATGKNSTTTTQAQKENDVWKIPATAVVTTSSPPAAVLQKPVDNRIPSCSASAAAGFQNGNGGKKANNPTTTTPNGKGTFSKGTDYRFLDKARTDLVYSGPRQQFIGFPFTPPVLDVDDGYLSMINRHEAPILWPEGFIESEAFSPEELKALAQSGALEAEPGPKTRLSTATEKTDYFSDDSLEFEDGDEPRTFIIASIGETSHLRRKSLAEIGSSKFPTEATVPASRKSWCAASGGGGAPRNVWRIGNPPKEQKGNSPPSSPVRKPCAFFIPLDDAEECGRSRSKVTEPSPKAGGCSSLPVNADGRLTDKSTPTTTTQAPRSLGQLEGHIQKRNSEAFVFDFSADSKSRPFGARTGSNRFIRSSLYEFVDEILGKAMEIGMQEADAINYLLDTPDDDEGQVSVKVSHDQGSSSSSSSNSPFLGKLNIGLRLSLEETSEIDEGHLYPLHLHSPGELLSTGSDQGSPATEISLVDVGSACMEVSDIEESGSEDEIEGDVSKVIQVEVEVIEEDLEDIGKTELIEDDQEPPPFVPAPPPIIHVISPPSPPEVSVSPDIDKKEKDEESDDSFNSNPVVQRDAILPKIEKRRPEKYEFKTIPEEDYRLHIQRQTSRSHENLVDIVGRRYGYLSPTGSHGHSSTLPPNSVPPHRKRSALRTFIDYFKKGGKKTDLNYSMEANSFYVDTPPATSSPLEGKQFIFNGSDPCERHFGGYSSPEVLNVSRISVSESPRGSQRSTNSRSGKKGVLSRLFRRKDK